jgi:hypothetical protein
VIDALTPFADGDDVVSARFVLDCISSGIWDTDQITITLGDGTTAMVGSLVTPIDGINKGVPFEAADIYVERTDVQMLVRSVSRGELSLRDPVEIKAYIETDSWDVIKTELDEGVLSDPQEVFIRAKALAESEAPTEGAE